MKDLKSLINEIETRRKSRERKQLIVGLAAAVVVLGATSLAVTVFSKPEPKPIVEATPAATAFDHVALSAKAAIVYDLTTGEILYAKNAEAQLPLASLTKLLTLYAASGALAKNTPVVISAKALEADGDTGFTEGETFAFEDLARLALVASSNDAAEAITEAATLAQHANNGTALLASAAASIGLSQTYALNGTGLDENGTISGAYGSAHDIAVLAGALLKRAPGIAHATIDPYVKVQSLSGHSYTLKNTNPDVGHIPGLLLSKTGFTDLAGGNLAIVFDAGIAHPVAIVVLGSTRDERFVDVNHLVRATAAQFADRPFP